MENLQYLDTNKKITRYTKKQENITHNQRKIALQKQIQAQGSSVIAPNL